MQIRQSESYRVGKEFLEKNTVLPRYCGEIDQVTWPWINGGSLHVIGDEGTASFRFNIHGAKASGNVQVRLRMVGRAWGVERAELLLRGSASPVSLIETNAQVRDLTSQVGEKPATRAAALSVTLPIIPAFLAWVFGMYSLVRLIRHRRDGVPLSTMLNPFTLGGR